MSESIQMQGPVCPIPLRHNERIVIGHGSGGKMTHDLIAQVFQPYFSNPALNAGNDFADVNPDGHRWAITTDSHIVQPLFFPGGDIGRLAVCGTVNDLAVSGARPLYLTAGFILEEGLEVAILQRVLDSMRLAAEEAGVNIVAGDTKVVEKGKADGLFINTAGFGLIPAGRQISGQMAAPGDAVLISGSLGDHAAAVLTARGEMGFDAHIESDVAPLNGLIEALLKAAPDTHVLRDPTRGGLATTLNEIAWQSQVNILLQENQLPVKPVVQSICDMLGFDPMYMANEGKLVIILPAEQAEAGLAAMRSHPYGRDAVRIGQVEPPRAGDQPRVLMRTEIGGTRLVDMLAGEILPRIC